MLLMWSLQVYANGSDETGFLSAIPLISESSLRHDADGETYNNGAFAVMERFVLKINTSMGESFYDVF